MSKEEEEDGSKLVTYLTNETLEGELPDQELGGLLVATDFTESDRTGPVTVRLLDTTGLGSGLAGGLGGWKEAGKVGQQCRNGEGGVEVETYPIASWEPCHR